jgi:hypothetical protein
MNKTIPAVKVHTHIVGSVQEFRQESARRATKPQREPNIRDVVGAAQCPSIGEVFGRQAA